MNPSEKIKHLKTIKALAEKIPLTLEHALNLTAILLYATEDELISVIKARIKDSGMIAAGLLVNKHGWEISRLEELLADVKREQALLN